MTTGTSSTACALGGGRPHVVGYDALRRAMDDRAEFFRNMAQSASIDYVQRASGSVVVARNFKLVRPIAHGSNGMVYEAKCIGEGHPALFRDQSYVLKVPFNYGVSTARVQNAFDNEYLISSTLEPHPNVNMYFCHFTDRIPQEYYDHLPPVAKELAYDTVRKRMHACVWVVLEHHSETLEQFLRDLNTTLRPLSTTTTPWPIVHKYSRDICAGLVHLFVNQTIHFDMKLNNIVISSNKEQAILIDLGCAMKFPRGTKPFEREIGFLVGAQGNASHRAPEILTGIAQYTQNPDRGSMLRCDKQPSFELGCILFELAMRGEHPLPGYPGGYGPSGHITFSFENEELFPMKSPAFPKAFCNLVRALLQFDPEKRMPLLEAAGVLENLESPSPHELASLYSGIVPLGHDAVSLTMKAACTILCGAPAEAYVELMRAIIRKQHRTLPELVVTVLWMRHISNDDDYHNVTQLLLKRVTTASQQLVSAPFSTLFLKLVIYSRNEMMIDALGQLETGNIDSALSLVSEACTLFMCEMNCINHWKNTEELQHWYLPGIVFLHSLCCIINDHVALCQHIPSNLLLAFSHALSTTPQLRDYCTGVIDGTVTPQGETWSNKAETIAEWSALLVTASVQSSATAQKSAILGFTTIWRILCSDQSVSDLRMELSSNMPAGGGHDVLCCVGPIHWGSVSLLFLSTYFSNDNTVALLRKAADAGDATAMCLLGASYKKCPADMNTAVTLFQSGADAGNVVAMFLLGECHHNGTGVEQNKDRALTLYKMAADTGNFNMSHLGMCYTTGDSFDIDLNKARSNGIYNSSVSACNPSQNITSCICTKSSDVEAVRTLSLFIAIELSPFLFNRLQD
ncbi:hypothetical protein Pelo_1614 [Pelomyxa schiedti]|nr:hypothetical protein Pelo_1614 [Pelomyxa schiedti]